MPYLEELPIVPSQTTISGDEILPIVDFGVPPNGTLVRKLPVYGILGLLPTDVTTVPGTSATVSTRLTVCTSTSGVTLTLPAASGNLRDITIMKASGTSSVTVNRAASPDVIVTGTSTTATSVTVGVGLTVRLLSDGTTWYHVTNDAP